MRHIGLFLVSTVVGLVAFAGLGHAAVIVVPSDQTTIQAAMAFANSGDLIQVTSSHVDTINGTPLRMKVGVTIVGLTGTEAPRIFTTLDTAITFPSQSYGSGTTTKVSGIRFVGSGYSCIQLKGLSGSGNVIIENCSFEAGSHGIEGYMPGTTATVTIARNSFVGLWHGVWLQDASSSVVLEENYFADCTGAGVGLEGGTPVLRNNTIIGCDWGVTKVGYVTPAPTLERNLILDCTYDGIGVLSAAYTTLSHNNCYGNDPNYNAAFGGGTPGSNLSQDPLLCPGEISVHVNSVCAPANNDWDVRIGRGGIACASGTLTNTTTLSSATTDSGEVLVTSDFTIPTGKALTVQEGVAVVVDDEDETGLGTSGTLNEIKIAGKLVVAGTNASKPCFVSALPSPAAGDWFGLIVDNGDLRMEFGRVAHAEYGITASTGDTVIIEKSVFESNSQNDVYIGSSPAYLLLSRNVVSAENIGFNLRCDDFTYATVSNNRISGSSTAVAGIQIDGVGSPPAGGATVSTDTVTAFSTGAGILIRNSTSSFTGNRVTDNKYGFHILGGTPAIGTTSSSSDNTIMDNTRGIFVQGSGPSTCYTVAPVIRNNRIDSNTHGVVTEKTAAPDLGTGSSDKGLNSILNSDTYCIWNRANSSCGTISAYGNYYGSCEEGVPPSCWSGLVWLGTSECTQPAGFGRGRPAVMPVLDGAAPFARIVAIHPNPLVASTRISLEVTGVDRALRLDIFDVSGRLVRSLVDRIFSPGTFHLTWDGTADTGVPVAEGLYFVRVLDSLGSLQSTKILVVR